MIQLKVPKNLQSHWVVNSFTDSNVFMNGRERGPRYFLVLWKSVIAYLGSSLYFVPRLLMVTSLQVWYGVLCPTCVIDNFPLVVFLPESSQTLTCEFHPKNVPSLLMGCAMSRNYTTVSQQKNVFLSFSYSFVPNLQLVFHGLLKTNQPNQQTPP